MNTRKLLALLLTVVMVLTVLPMTIFADGGTGSLGGDSDPPQIPEAPALPAFEDLAAWFGSRSIEVACVHNPSHDNCTYAPIKGSYRIGNLRWNGGLETYLVDITFNPELYIQQYDIDTNAKHRLSPAAQGSKTVTFRLANGEDGGDIVIPNPDFPIISPNDPGGTYDPGHGEGELRDNWIPLNQDFNVSWTVTCEEEHIPPRRLYDDTRPNPTGDLTRRDANPNTGAYSTGLIALAAALGTLGAGATAAVRKRRRSR